MLSWLVPYMRLLGLLRASAAADVLAEFVERFNRVTHHTFNPQADSEGKYRNSS